MLEAVDDEFRSHGLQLDGAAGDLISTSGKWQSNIQRDMMRKCKASRVSCCIIIAHVLLSWS